MTDPICGMNVEPERAAGSHVHNGQTYYFCSRHCLAEFKEDPERFLKSPAAGHAAHGEGHSHAQAAPSKAKGNETEQGVYVCPMDPEVRESKPGACPKCGMAFEPRTVTLEEEANPELVDMTRRFWVGVVLSLPIAFLAMSEMIPGQPLQRSFSPRLLNWLQLVLATPVVLWGGWPFFQRGWTSIVNRSLNMFTLIAIGVDTA